MTKFTNIKYNLKPTSKNQVTLPLDLAQKLNVKTNDFVNVFIKDGRIYIEKSFDIPVNPQK